MDDDKYINMLKNGSMIERVGSFKPPLRKGFSANRGENRIQKKMAQKLYSKRVEIAKSMANSTSTNTREVVYSALVSSGISPNSVDYYDEYIQVLVDRQGGWDRWRKIVIDELSMFYYLKKTMRNPLSIVITWFMLTIATSGVFPNHQWSPYIPVTMTAMGIVFVSFYFGQLYPEYRKNVYSLIGDNNKDVDNFFSYSRVRQFSTSG